MQRRRRTYTFFPPPGVCDETEAQQIPCRCSGRNAQTVDRLMILAESLLLCLTVSSYCMPTSAQLDGVGRVCIYLHGMRTRRTVRCAPSGLSRGTLPKALAWAASNPSELMVSLNGTGKDRKE